LHTVALETIETGMTAAVGEEDTLLINAGLHDVVRRSNGDGTRESSHLLEKRRRG